MSKTKDKPTKSKLQKNIEGHIESLGFGRDATADPFPSSMVENQRVREALKRNREYGDLPLDVIQADSDQVRQVRTDTSEFQELMASIKEHGVLQPIQVRWLEDSQIFQVIAGNRRFTAAQQVGLNTIPVVLKDVDDTKKAIHQLVENLQRENLNPVEEAKAFQRYLAATGKSQDQLAREIGKSKTYVSRILTLLERLSTAEQYELSQVAPAQLPGKSLIYEAISTSDKETRLAILRGQLKRKDARKATQPFKRRTATGRPRNIHQRFKQLPNNPVKLIATYPKGTTADQLLEMLIQARREVEKET